MRVVHSLSTGAAEMSRFQWSSLGKTLQLPTLGPPAAVLPPVLAEPEPPVQELAAQLPPVGALPPDGAPDPPAPAPPVVVPPFETAPFPPLPLAPAIPAPATFPTDPALVPGSADGRSEQPQTKSAKSAPRQKFGIERF
jgi:hypothetical protein